jgi:uncharacterized protein (TIGR02266 family)
VENEKRPSILLADDSQTFLMYIGILIKRLGYQTLLARDGAEALKIAKEQKPSLIILDYMMPKIDGSSCLSIIRGEPDIKDIPVIMLTSHESARQELEQAGCCYFLRKPVDISEFYRAVRSCMKLKNYPANKRENIRISLNKKVFIECGDESRELYTLSISNEGLFLRTVAPFKEGTEMKVIFNVDEEDPIELNGRVLYSNKMSTEVEPEPGMGVQFLDVPEDVKPRLKGFILSQLADDLTTEAETVDKDAYY